MPHHDSATEFSSEGRFSTREDYYGWNEEMIRRYDPAKYYQFSIIRLLESARFRHILNTLRRFSERGRFLEVGCGHGFMLSHVARAGHFATCVGIDISLPSLLEARSRVGPSLLVQADGEFLGLRSEIFDAVCLTEVIEHVPDQVSVLKEASRMLVPGGVLLVTAPNERLIDSLKTVVYGLRLDRILFWQYKPSQRMAEEWHLHAMSRRSLREIIARAGLHPVKWVRLPFWFLPLRNLVVCMPEARG